MAFISRFLCFASLTSCIEVARIVQDAADTARIAKFATMASMGLDGTISGRIVYPKPPNASLGESPDLSVVRFATLNHTRKFKEIQANPSVTLVYYDDAGKGEVTIKGVVLVCNASEAAAGWYDRWKHTYAEGPATPNYALLRLEATSLEFVSYVRFKVDEGGNRSDWRPLTLKRQPGSEWRYVAPALPKQITEL